MGAPVTAGTRWPAAPGPGRSPSPSPRRPGPHTQHDGGQYESSCSRSSHFGAFSECRIGPGAEPGRVPQFGLRALWLRLRTFRFALQLRSSSLLGSGVRLLRPSLWLQPPSQKASKLASSCPSSRSIRLLRSKAWPRSQSGALFALDSLPHRPFSKSLACRCVSVPAPVWALPSRVCPSYAAKALPSSDEPRTQSCKFGVADRSRFF
jgi:hypothetical protein